MTREELIAKVKRKRLIERVQSKRAAADTAPVEAQNEGVLGDIARFAEPALTMASSIVAEPIAGIAGIAQSLNPLAEPGAGARAVEAQH